MQQPAAHPHGQEASTPQPATAEQQDLLLLGVPGADIAGELCSTLAQPADASMYIPPSYRLVAKA